MGIFVGRLFKAAQLRKSAAFVGAYLRLGAHAIRKICLTEYPLGRLAWDWPRISTTDRSIKMQ
jgi:hypothetical protein